MNPACTHCHAPLHGNETFCRHCGTLTDFVGQDPTLIIRRPGPDASSPWAKLGARTASRSVKTKATGAPITVGTSATQVPTTDPVSPAYRPRVSERALPPTGEEGPFEQTRIVRNQRGPLVLKGWLVAIDGPEKGESWTIRAGKNRIGRADGMDVLLQEGSISSNHAVLWVGENDIATLFDPESSNGTFVDGQQVFLPTEIQDGALIRFGEKTTLQWVRFIPRTGV